MIDKTLSQAIGCSQSILSEHTKKEEAFQVRSTSVVSADEERELIVGKEGGLVDENCRCSGGGLAEKNY